jgi:nucleoid DNA-binding protein
MKKAQLAVQEGKRQQVEPGSAADQMDRAVNRIIQALRSGKSAELPGLGTIRPGKRWVFRASRPKGSGETRNE